MHPRRPAPPPTPQQLQQAFDSRRRRGWPETLEAAMAVPLYAALVRMQARRIAEQQARRAELERAGVERFNTQSERPMPPVPNPQPARRLMPTLPFDRKRLASGDRDDD